MLFIAPWKFSDINMSIVGMDNAKNSNIASSLQWLDFRLWITSIVKILDGKECMDIDRHSNNSKDVFCEILSYMNRMWTDFFFFAIIFNPRPSSSLITDTNPSFEIAFPSETVKRGHK